LFEAHGHIPPLGSSLECSGRSGSAGSRVFRLRLHPYRLHLVNGRAPSPDPGVALIWTSRRDAPTATQRSVGSGSPLIHLRVQLQGLSPSESILTATAQPSAVDGSSGLYQQSPWHAHSW